MCIETGWDYKEQAAEALKLTADHMYKFGLIDGVVPEPLGGAHHNPEETAKTLKAHIKKNLAELMKLSVDKRIKIRIDKYSAMGKTK